MYYGNSSASDQSDAVNTWTSNYKMVQHMKDDTTSTILDSTTNNNDGVKVSANNPIETTSGKIGNAQAFSADNITVSSSSSLDISTSWTMSGWFKNNAVGGVHDGIMSRDTGSGTRIFSLMLLGTSGYIYLHHYTPSLTAHTFTTLGSLDDGVWHYFSIRNDGTDLIMTVDGNTEIAIGFGGNTIGGVKDLLLGVWRVANAEYFNGDLDELRISNTEQTSTWVSTEYNNQNSPGTFYSLDTQENVPLSNGIFFGNNF